MWPGNTADVTTLIPIIERMRERFSIRRFCIVDDRGMISHKTLKTLEDESIPYILGTRMRRVKAIKTEVLFPRGGPPVPRSVS
jgi:transposase